MFDSLLKSGIRAGAAFYTGGASEAIYQNYEGYENQNEIRKANERNQALQKEFAQNSIQCKVNDATKAGIHPLAALGASTSSPSFASQPVTGSTKGDIVQRVQQTKLNKTQLESMKHDNVLKAAQASKLAVETQKMAIDNTRGRNLYIDVYDPITGKTIKVVDPEIAESMDSAAANLVTLRGNVTGKNKKPDKRRTNMSRNTKSKTYNITKKRSRGGQMRRGK